MDPKDIERGWDVYGSDGEKVGDVSDVQRGYITVSSGWIFTSERYVPISAIERIEHDRVQLGVTKDEIEARGWDTIPEERATVEDRPARPTAAPAQAVRTTEPERPARRDEAERPARRDEGQTIQLREEELRARKERAQAGEVEITKDVVSEEKTLEVPVMHEEIVVERHAVDRRPADRPIGEGETIEVPLYEEKVEFDKQAVVYEEVGVGKRQVQETERFSETVRREELDVDSEGDVNVSGGAATRGARAKGGGRSWEEAGPSYRQAWERRSGANRGRWEDAEPGYRFGHEAAADPRYRDRDWDDVEPDLRTDYGDWAKRQGYRAHGDDDSAWQRLSENVREAWEGTRRTAGRR